MVAVAFIVAAVLGGRLDERRPRPRRIGAGGRRRGASAPAAQTAAQLGYPAFATNNTTRVGGADPASNAAGVALATYPSTTPALRPAAVTLVGEDDWQGAIAASVLMAAPVRAPLLISAQGTSPVRPPARSPPSTPAAAAAPAGRRRSRSAKWRRPTT